MILLTIVAAIGCLIYLMWHFEQSRFDQERRDERMRLRHKTWDEIERLNNEQ